MGFHRSATHTLEPYLGLTGVLMNSYASNHDKHLQKTEKRIGRMLDLGAGQVNPKHRLTYTPTHLHLGRECYQMGVTY